MVKKGLNILLILLAVAGLGLLGLFLFVATGLSGPLPSPEILKTARNPLKTQVLDVNGSVLGSIYSENRVLVPISECPPFLLDALVSTEDSRFFSHHGIDFLSLPRVLIKGILLSSSSAGGGSTITQQLAKNLYPRTSYLILGTPVNKFREMIVAHRVESVLSKEEILELYLNTVPFGELAFGIGTASNRFFGKKPADLRPEECATLVGMLKAPTYYSPRRFPERATIRRNVVLGQMSKCDKLPESVKDSLQQVPLRINYTPDARASELSAYFISFIEKEARRLIAESMPSDAADIPDPRKDGLKIYTTIDAKLQRYAEAAVKNQMPRIQAAFNKDWGNKPDWETPSWTLKEAQKLQAYKRLQQQGLGKEEILKELSRKTSMSVFAWDEKDKSQDFSVVDSLRYYKRLLQTGLVSMDPANGHIKCWVGGADHRYFPYDHVLARRQAGSSFKPFLYTAALESGIGVCDYFDNLRVTHENYDDWSPRNASNSYGGSYSLQGALTYSVNTVAASLINEIGIDPVIEVARKLGITSPIPKVPSIALGTAEVSMLEMTTAYCPLANGGQGISPVYILKIEDHMGNTIYEHSPGGVRKDVLADTIAQAMLTMLETVVDSGTAQSLRSQFALKIPLAGKTGTTQRYTDGWFIGITPGLVTSVWVGADDPVVHFRSGAGAGGRTALRIFGSFLHGALGESGLVKAVSTGNGRVKFMSQTPRCPLYSSLPAEEIMDILHDRQNDEWTFSEFIESIFSNKEDDPRAEEQRLLNQMQNKLDRTAARLRKRNKSPMEIRRRLDEIREEYYQRINALKDESQ